VDSENSLSVNNQICDEVKHEQLKSLETVTPLPTQIEAVELINQIAEQKEVKFQLSQKAINKLKNNWGQKVAKQQHKQCNEMAMKIAKESKMKLKSANRMQRQVKKNESGEKRIEAKREHR
jgi:hypothetical protein